MKPWTTPLFLSVLLAWPAVAREGGVQADTPQLTLERVFASPDLAGPGPRGLKLSPDGRLVTYLKGRSDDRDRHDLWARDTATGEERMLVDSAKVGSGAELSEAEKMQRERARIGGLTGIVGYDWAPDGTAVLVPLDGDLYRADLAGNVTRLTDTDAGELNAEISPRGSYVSFVRDGNLWVLPEGGSATAITDGATATLSWGLAEFVAQEEMDRTRGYWWAPDDRRIAVARVDESPVGVVTRAAIGADGTRLYEQRYPAAGTANARVDLFVMNPDGGDRVQVDLGDDPDIYLARVDWAPDGRTLYVQRQNRAQTRLDLLAVDPATGAARTVLTDRAKSWLNLHGNFRALKDGSFLWWSEKSGHGHLYRVRGSRWTALTRGAWQVRDIIGVDEAAGSIWFTGNRDTPLEQHVYRVPMRGGEVARLTEPGWWHGARMDGGRMLVTRSSPSQPAQTYLADRDGKRIGWISENRLDDAHPYARFVPGHRLPVFGTLTARDGAVLHTKLLTPPLEAGRRYPVWYLHYGGPGAGRQVTRQWGGAVEQYLVDRGWIVFALDNRGTPDRGKAFEDPIHRAMGTVEVEDQLAGLDWLKAQSFVDPDRIVTYGWSYGGYLTLKLLQAAPGQFAGGISGAPVTDWTLYDTHYTERYLGMPSGPDNAYPAAGTIADAASIADPLLIVHGMADDNVVLDNTTKMMAAMQEKAVRFESMLYPGQTHRVGGPGVSVHLWRTMLDFADRAAAPAPDQATR